MYQIVSDHGFNVLLVASSSLTRAGYIPRHCSWSLKLMGGLLEFYTTANNNDQPVDMYKVAYAQVLNFSYPYLPGRLSQVVGYNRITRKLYTTFNMMMYEILWQGKDLMSSFKKFVIKNIKIICATIMSQLLISHLITISFCQFLACFLGFSAAWQLIVLTEVLRYVVCAFSHECVEKAFTHILPRKADDLTTSNPEQIQQDKINVNQSQQIIENAEEDELKPQNDTSIIRLGDLRAA